MAPSQRQWPDLQMDEKLRLAFGTLEVGGRVYDPPVPIEIRLNVGTGCNAGIAGQLDKLALPDDIPHRGEEPVRVFEARDIAAALLGTVDFRGCQLVACRQELVLGVGKGDGALRRGLLCKIGRASC